MRTIYVHEHPAEPPSMSIFLAGPSPRAEKHHDWRKIALRLLSSRLGFTGTVYVPLPRDGQYHPDYDKEAQMAWELRYLEACTAIAFWVPRDLKALPGFTTNVEFGLFAQSGKVVLGYPPQAPKMNYLKYIATKWVAEPISVLHSLQETMQAAIKLAHAKARAQ